MASLPSQVQPGDLISSDLMNEMLDELASLKSAIDQFGAPTGTVPVPNLFGLTLSEARAIITQPARQVTLGTVIDITGVTVDPLAQTNRLRVVLTQSPTAGARVQPGYAINLVVSASPDGSSGPVAKPPTITELQTPDGTTTTTFAVGDGMVIVGTNFDPTPPNNAVSFNGISVTPKPNANDPTRRLIIVVPTGIPNAPSEPGQTSLEGVNIVVTTPVASASTTCTVAAPSATPPPQITGITPAFAPLSGSVTVNGTGFSTTASENTVHFGDAAGTVTNANATSLTVDVPAALSGLNNQGDNQLVDVTVAVNGVPGVAPFQITVYHP